MHSVFCLIGSSDIEVKLRQEVSVFSTPPLFVSIPNEALSYDSKRDIFQSLRDQIAGRAGVGATVPVFAVASKDADCGVIRNALSFLYAIMRYGLMMNADILFFTAFDPEAKDRSNKLALFSELQTAPDEAIIVEKWPRIDDNDHPWRITNALINRLTLFKANDEGIDCECLAKYCSLFEKDVVPSGAPTDVDPPRLFTVCGEQLQSRREHIVACAKKAFLDHVYETIENGNGSDLDSVKETDFVNKIVSEFTRLVSERMPYIGELYACMTTGSRAKAGVGLKAAEKTIFGDNLSRTFTSEYSMPARAVAIDAVSKEIKSEIRRRIYELLGASKGCGVSAIKRSIQDQGIRNILNNIINKTTEKRRTLEENANAAGVKKLASTGLIIKRDPSLGQSVEQIIESYYSAKLAEQNNELRIEICQRLQTLFDDFANNSLGADLNSVRGDYISTFTDAVRNSDISEDEKEQLKKAYEMLDDAIFEKVPALPMQLMEHYCSKMGQGDRDGCIAWINELTEKCIGDELENISELPRELRLRERLLKRSGVEDAHGKICRMLQRRAGAQTPQFTIFEATDSPPWNTHPDLNELYLFLGANAAEDIGQMTNFRIITTSDEQHVYVVRVWADKRLDRII